MALIKIINGTYGHRPDGSNYVLPITCEDPPISVSEEEAERLIGLGVAERVSDSQTAEPEAEAPDLVEDALDRETLKGMKLADLKKLAEDGGIDPAGMKKDALIDAILAGVPELSVEDVVE